MNYDDEAGSVTAEVRMRGCVRSEDPFLVNFPSENKKEKKH